MQIILNNTVASQNEGWAGNSVQWRSTPEQVPVGTKIKIRLSDSDGQMVLSDITEVVGDSDASYEDYGGEKPPTWHKGMDDPRETNNRKTFGLEFGIGPSGITLGVNRGPATPIGTETSPVGIGEPTPTGVPDWEARYVARALR